jgi:hypothetical protein
MRYKWMIANYLTAILLGTVGWLGLLVWTMLLLI